MHWEIWPILKELVEKDVLLDLDLYFAESVLKNVYGTVLASDSQAHAALLSFLFAICRQGHLVLNTKKHQFAIILSQFSSLDLEAFKALLVEGVEMFDKNTSTLSPWIYRKGSCYYLQKNWMIENEILKNVIRLKESSSSLSFVNAQPSLGNALQKQAILNALSSNFSLLTGGPGTGKTFTAAEIIKTILATLSEEAQQSFHIIICAPTGKAVIQLENALKKSLKIQPKLQSGTLHSLLKIKGFIREWEDTSPLFADLIIVDECSMIDAYIFAKFIASVASTTRLVLIGDKHQLPPVEAGSVFADLVDSKMFKTTELIESLRSDCRSILEFAKKIQKADADAALEMLMVQKEKDLNWMPLSSEMTPDFLCEAVHSRFSSFYSEHPDPKLLLSQINQFAVLSCTRKGRFGVDALNAGFIHQFLKKVPSNGVWWAIPVMITQNDRDMQLFNGDQGILLRKIRAEIGLKEVTTEDFAYFLDPHDPLGYRKITALSLPSYEYCYALSVHKSQGSEFDEIMIVAAEGAEHFGREVLYTAITRARHSITLMSTEDTMRKAISRSSLKFSGILEHLTEY